MGNSPKMYENLRIQLAFIIKLAITMYLTCSAKVCHLYLLLEAGIVNRSVDASPGHSAEALRQLKALVDAAKLEGKEVYVALIFDEIHQTKINSISGSRNPWQSQRGQLRSSI